MGISTVQKIVKDVADAVWDVLCMEYIAPPAGPADWLRIA